MKSIVSKVLIRLEDVKAGKISHGDLKKRFNALPIQYLVSPDAYLIAFECLSLLNFKGLKNDHGSIDKAIAKLFELLHFRPVGPSSTINRFISVMLQFNRLPHEYKTALETEAEADLVLLNELIEYYDTLKFIKLYNSSESMPRNHEEGTILAFYKRTIKKQNEVVKYLISGASQMAVDLAKNNQYSSFVKETIGRMVQVALSREYPYKDLFFNSDFICKIDFERLDYRKINVFRTKIFIKGIMSKIGSNCPVDELNKILIKNIDKKYYFDYIIENASLVPLIGGRTEIFEELKYLFYRKKWYAFYALALPQVEGIFADMMQVVAPGKGTSGALPEKVSAIRPFHSTSDKFFDYYEYFLPTQRNKFSHTGKDEDIKTKSYHMLGDLWYIIHVFTQLETPLLEVIRMVREGIGKFKDVSHISKFIALVFKLKIDKAFSDKEEYVMKFIALELAPRLSSKDLFDALQADVNYSVNKIDESTSAFSAMVLKKTISFSEMSRKYIIENKANIKPLFSSVGILREDSFKLIIDVNIIVRGIHKLDGVPISLKGMANEFYLTNQELLDKISLFTKDGVLGLDLSDISIMLGGKEWEHAKILNK